MADALSAMLEDPAFVAILNPSEWPGRARNLCRFLGKEAGSEGPVVAYGVNGEAAITYLDRDGARRAGLDPAEVEKKAVAHLVAREGRANWRKEEIGGVQVFLRRGDDLTAADILSVSAMKHLQEKLKVKELLVAIPDRFTMVTCPDATALAAIARSLYEDAGERGRGPLTPIVFRLDGGRVIGVAGEAAEDAGEDAPADPEVTWYRPKGLLEDDGEGGSTLVLALSCEGPEELRRAILYELESYTAPLLEREGLNGRLLFKVDSSGVPPGDGRVRIEELIRAINEHSLRKGFKTAGGRPLAVSLEWIEPRFRLKDDG